MKKSLAAFIISNTKNNVLFETVSHTSSLTILVESWH